MHSKYTIFKDGFTTKEYKIYRGILGKEDKTREMVYRIREHDKMTELYGLTNTNNYSILLKSKYTNWSKTKSLMEGFNTTFSMEKSGVFTGKWVFEDRLDHKKTYTWKNRLFDGSYWYLKDNQGQLIADFEYASWSRKKQGTLTTYRQLPSHLMATILLSHITIYQSIKRNAGSRGAMAGSLASSGGGGGAGGC